MMRSAHGIAVLAAVAALSALGLTRSAGHAQPRAATKGVPPLVGIVSGPKQQWLVRADTKSLKPVARAGRTSKLALDGHTFGWSFSPTGDQLVLGRDRIPELRFLDVRRFRRLGKDLGVGDWDATVAATAWFDSQTLVAVVAGVDCCPAVRSTTVLWIDPLNREIVRRQPLDEALVRVAKGWGGIALLLAPPVGIGPSRLAVVDRSGVRVVPLGISSGTEYSGDESDPRARTNHPALAVDSNRQVAYVVAADGEVAEVNLATLTITTRRPVATGRQLSAPAKFLEGSVRHAVVLPGGVIAATGTDYTMGKDASGRPSVLATPSGLHLVNPYSWTVRAVDAGATSLRVMAGGELVASGPRSGVAAFGFDGVLRFRAFPGKYAWIVEAFDKRAYVRVGNSRRVKVIDVMRGVVGERKQAPPSLLVDGAWNPWS